MSKILIIGGGFAGLSACHRLGKSGLGLDITLVDKKETSDFLPMLPDCLGRGIDPQFLACKIEDTARKTGFKFIRDEVVSIDLQKREVLTKQRALNYDYLVIASGSETNFYGNEVIRSHAYALDGADDAIKINAALRQGGFANFIIGGGGYTGIEVATNLRLYADKMGKEAGIIIVERAAQILGPLPEWMRNYTAANLKRMRIEVFTNATIEGAEEERVYLSGGKIFHKALLVWAAGVKTAGFIQNLNSEKNPQGRIKVDSYLRLNETCFVAGDAAYFAHQNGFLRMAVQFAITQGSCAAINIIKSIGKKKLEEYRPLDLGYIIPMANNRSCGKVTGFNFKGHLPTILHFTMCVYRSCGWKNKSGVIKALLNKRR
ncbi:MAG: FAD-dependent oxidoreductase [Candidatus Omnitrophota bacterium]|jgi:NADH dehydrogenase